MVLRVSDLPIITENELQNVDDDSLIEISLKGDGYDSWVSRSMKYGDLKEQAVLCVANQDFEFLGDKIFNNSLSVGGNITLSGSFIMNKDNVPATNSEFFVKTTNNKLISLTDNTITATENNNFYADDNRFFGKVEFNSKDSDGSNPFITINSSEESKLKVVGDITCDELHGTSTTARWGDLAEYFISDRDYEPGTLIKFGGDKEITIANDLVNGVITTKPGISINSDLTLSEDEYVKGVALIGRVPIKVKGKVSKFDNIKLSDMNGIGEASTDVTDVIIGKALQDKNTYEVSTIECVVKLTL